MKKKTKYSINYEFIYSIQEKEKVNPFIFFYNIQCLGLISFIIV